MVSHRRIPCHYMYIWCNRNVTSYSKSEIKKSSKQEKMAEQQQQPVCATCGRSGKLYLCDRCRAQRYCSSACQKSDWPAHKPNCIPWKNLVVPALEVDDDALMETVGAPVGDNVPSSYTIVATLFEYGPYTDKNDPGFRGMWAKFGPITRLVRVYMALLGHATEIDKSKAALNKQFERSQPNYVDGFMDAIREYEKIVTVPGINLTASCAQHATATAKKYQEMLHARRDVFAKTPVDEELIRIERDMLVGLMRYLNPRPKEALGVARNSRVDLVTFLASGMSDKFPTQDPTLRGEFGSWRTPDYDSMLACLYYAEEASVNTDYPTRVAHTSLFYNYTLDALQKLAATRRYVGTNSIESMTRTSKAREMPVFAQRMVVSAARYERLRTWYQMKFPAIAGLMEKILDVSKQKGGLDPMIVEILRDYVNDLRQITDEISGLPWDAPEETKKYKAAMDTFKEFVDLLIRQQ